MVEDEDYIVIMGWMITKLNLKGSELYVYALIYGFSKDNESKYYGSRKYIAEWFNCSLPTIDKALNGLLEKKYIIKETEIINGVIFNRYRCNKETLQGIKNLYRGVKNLYGGYKESLHNNTSIYNKYNTSIYNNIVEYLNKKIGSNYKSTTNKTRSLIKARLDEGFSEDDFYKVIDNKYKEWKDTDMQKYLRPETLFGTKFESYLNQKIEVKEEWWKKYDN